MKKSFLQQLRSVKKTKTQQCDTIDSSRRSPRISSAQIPKHKEGVLVLTKNNNDIEAVRTETKNIPTLKLGCRLLATTYKIRDIVSPISIVHNYVRMFHGARSNQLQNILRHGIKPIGSGVLGNGFYMTPSLSKALLYTSKDEQFSIHTYPIVLELFVPANASVCCMDRNKPSTCCAYGDLYTETEELWQFTARDKDFLQNIRFNVWLIT